MTKQDATTIVDRLNSQTYLLSYGEYERPDYHVRKKRGADSFEIRVRYYYYHGALYPKQNGVLNPELIHKANY